MTLTEETDGNNDLGRDEHNWRGTYLTSRGQGAVDIEENEFLDRPISKSGRNHRAGIRRGIEGPMQGRQVDGRREEGGRYKCRLWPQRRCASESRIKIGL